MQVVRLAGKRHVIGLWWQVRQGSLDMKRQARALNQELGGQYTHIVFRQDQWGMGQGKFGARGSSSLASILAEKGGSRLLVCHFPDASCWWVCAIKDGRIAAEGDWTGSDEAQAQAHAAYLRHMLELPEMLVIRDAEDRDALAAEVRSIRRGFFSHLSGLGRVQGLASRTRSLLIFGSTIAAMVLFFFAYSAGLFTDDALTRQMLEQRRLAIQSNPGRHFPRPWLENATVPAWSARCVKLLLQTPFTEKGWELRVASCTGNSAELQWEFTQSASFLHVPDGAALLTPTTASKKIAFENLPPAPQRDMMMRDAVARRLYELARLLGLHLKLEWKDKARKVIREGSLSVPVIAPWYEGTFTIDNVSSITIMDKDLYEAFHSIPGLVLQSVTYSNGTWKIKGLCHGT